MYNVIICCDGISSLYSRLHRVWHRLKLSSHADRELLLNLLETGRVSQISAQAPILILPRALHQPIIGAERVFAVIANSDFFEPSDLHQKFPGAQIITCGMHQQDTLSFSSFDREQAVISLQSAITAMSGETLLPQEFPLAPSEPINRFDLLACAALLLLCGKGRQLAELIQ